MAMAKGGSATGQEDNSAHTTAFTGSDIGLDTAQVR